MLAFILVAFFCRFLGLCASGVLGLVHYFCLSVRSVDDSSLWSLALRLGLQPLASRLGLRSLVSRLGLSLRGSVSGLLLRGSVSVPSLRGSASCFATRSPVSRFGSRLGLRLLTVVRKWES